MLEPEFSPALLRYFAIREEQRQREIDECWPRLEADVAAYVAEHPDDPGLPKVLARLIRDAAVAAYVRGTMQAAGTRVDLPPSSVMLHAALETCRSMRDLYPGFAKFDGKTSDESEESDA